MLVTSLMLGAGLVPSSVVSELEHSAECQGCMALLHKNAEASWKGASFAVCMVPHDKHATKPVSNQITARVRETFGS